MCFFFQAEDGIRDLTVTGVQTCALPILAGAGFVGGGAGKGVGAGAKAGLSLGRVSTKGFGNVFVEAKYTADEVRSEERRVGKECRSQWATDHSKKKKNHQPHNHHHIHKA